MNQFNTQQEKFWFGEFGNDYISRNQGDKILKSNITFFKKALEKTSELKTCIEFGSNIGMNIQALKKIFPDQKHHAIEINPLAVSYLEKIMPRKNIINDSILNFNPFQKWDLVLIKGVLIHINPEMLPKVYEKLVNSTGRYLLVNEYYNDVPVEINYRGHKEKLFKRDFVGEILDSYSEFKLVDYGFLYHKDLVHSSSGDTNWFLLEKN